MSDTRSTEKKKRYIFLGATGAGVATTVLLTPWLGVPALVAGGYLGWDWFSFRAKNGMRF